MIPEPDRVLPETEVVIVGLGWAGGIIASELAKAGAEVVAIERGPDRTAESSEVREKHDALRFRVRHDMFQDVAQETWTLRHDRAEGALPIRYLGAFAPASGVGGSSAHYGGITTRFTPWEFEMRSQTLERYGAEFIPEDCTIADWGITYDELEPYYTRFERAVGVSGQAGNLRGRQVEGGNPFEGPRAEEFPLPPLAFGAGPTLVADAARSLGWHPYPTPTAILSKDYTSPDGVSRAGCTYCGDCTWHVCAVGAKGDSRVAFLPIAKRSPRFRVVDRAYVVGVTHDGKRATGVRYFDHEGRLIEQPAHAVVLSAYALNNVRLLLLSGLGVPYDPVSGEGVVGRNYAHQILQVSTGFFAGRKFRSYMGAGTAFQLDDFANDNFDHAPHGFIGGGQILGLPQHSLIQGPALPPGSGEWGAAWQESMAQWYDTSLAAAVVGHSLAYRGNHLDLDPTYKDAWGMPLLRITFDWRDNERRIAAFMNERVRELWRAAGADVAVVPELIGHFDTARYQGTHNTGGAVMGTDPASSVVNSSLRMWDVENLWVVGGSAFPQNGVPGPTGTIGALAYRAADGLVDYLGVDVSPGLRAG